MRPIIQTFPTRLGTFPTCLGRSAIPPTSDVPKNLIPHTPLKGCVGKVWEGQGIVSLGTSEKGMTFPILGTSQQEAQ